MTTQSPSTGAATRRSFLKTTTLGAAGAVLASEALLPQLHAAGSDTIKVGVIGCGGRGTGAAENVLNSAKGVQIVAIGDVFKDRVEGCRNRLLDLAKGDRIKGMGNSVELPMDRCFTGLKAYQDVINSGANYIILATPPGFRPIHIEAAIAAGKTLFTEKPVGVDGPGIRRVMAAYEVALKKGIGVAAGTQRRHQAPYIETIKKIHDGAIGDVTAARVFWNQGILWKRPRRPGMTDAEYQVHNWYNFTWLCGDHIVEQHVHNLDVMNWALQGHPLSCIAGGFRTRTDPEYGHIYDFFAINYQYPKHVQGFSMCRQISGCTNRVGEDIIGTKGICQVENYRINGQQVAKRGGSDPYVQEHTDLIASVRESKPINELKNVAESTLTAIMGRMSAYTGLEVSWEQALNSKEVLMPENFSLEMSLPMPQVSIPGKTRLS